MANWNKKLEELRASELNENHSTLMSSAELKAKLFTKLDTDGTFNQLRALLRNELVKHLFVEEPRGVCKVDASKVDVTAPKYPIEGTNWLIADHLLRNHFDFTYSVFCLECGKTKSFIQEFSIADIVKFLGIDPSSKAGLEILDIYQNEREGSFIWHLLDAGIRNILKNSRDAIAQVDILDEDQSVDRNLPETSLFRRDFGNFNQRTDLRRCYEEIERLRGLVEDRYQNKLKILIDREKESTNAIEKRSNRMEEEFYFQRQRYLAEVANLKQREEEWETRREFQEKMLNLENLRLKKAREALKEREDNLNKLESEHENLMVEERRRIVQKEQREVIAMENGLKEKESELRSRELRCEAKEKMLREKEVEFSEKVNESVNLQLELKVLKEECDKRNEQISLLKIHEDASVENVSLRSEVERSKRALSEANENFKAEQRRHYNLMHELLEKFAKPSPQVAFLEKEIATLQGLQEELHEERKSLESQLKKAEEQRKSFFERFKLQREKILDMQKQIDDLQAKLIWKTPTNSAVKQLLFDSSKFNTEQQERGLRSFYVDPTIDLHGTYFDTSISASHLPPELELGLSESNLDPIGYSESTPFYERLQNSAQAEMDSTKARIRALEMEAEMLEQDYQLLKAKRPVSYSVNRYSETKSHSNETTPVLAAFSLAANSDEQSQPCASAAVKRKLNFGFESEIKENVECAENIISSQVKISSVQKDESAPSPSKDAINGEEILLAQTSPIDQHDEFRAVDKLLDDKNSSPVAQVEITSGGDEKSVAVDKIPSIVKLDQIFQETAEDSVKSESHQSQKSSFSGSKLDQKDEVIQVPMNLDDAWKYSEQDSSSESVNKDDAKKLENISHLNSPKSSADDNSDW